MSQLRKHASHQSITITRLAITIALGVLLEFTLVPPVYGDLDQKTVPRTPAEVWAGFDPRTEPLEVEIKRRWTETNVSYTKFYFTGLKRGKDTVRVYAVYAVPLGAKQVPAILQLHGGGQTANLDWLRFWTARGYAALTFDWSGGQSGSQDFTQWGSLHQCKQKEGFAVQPINQPVRDSCWYLWTCVARRALTALERQPEVDKTRLGVLGVSMGGSMVWLIAGMDPRVRAACTVYGAGWSTYPDETAASDVFANDKSMMRWRRLMEPESYARLVRCPILFLGCTNDHYGKMDWVYRTLQQVSAPCRQAFTVNFRHHVAAAEAADLPLWMDTWLKKSQAWPETPVMRISLGADGVPRLKLKPDRSQPIKSVQLYYAVENPDPKSRFWRSNLAPDHSGDTYESTAPIFNPKEPMYAYANVHYMNGVCLSSNLVAITPNQLGMAKATDSHVNVIDDFRFGDQDWVTSSPSTDPLPQFSSLLRMVQGPKATPAISTTMPASIITRKIGDPKWRGASHFCLQFRVFLRTLRIVRVTVHENEETPEWKQYQKEYWLAPSPVWQTFMISPSMLVTEKGQQLGNWDKVRSLELSSLSGSGEEPIFTDFRWVPER